MNIFSFGKVTDQYREYKKILRLLQNTLMLSEMKGYIKGTSNELNGTLGSHPFCLAQASSE